MKIPWCCPVCSGTGLVSRPPGVAGDVSSWIDSSVGPYTCPACGGSKIIWSEDNEKDEGEENGD